MHLVEIFSNEKLSLPIRLLDIFKNESIVMRKFIQKV